MSEETGQGPGEQGPDDRGSEQPTRVMRPAARERLGGALAKLRGLGSGATRAVVVVALVLAPTALATFAGIKLIGGGDEEAKGGPATIQSADSSWIVGQASLASYPGYEEIAELAYGLGDERFASYQDLLAYIEDLRKWARQWDLIGQAKALLAECREARRAYKQELREAAREQRQEQQRIKEKQEAIQERIERLREKYKIEPGQECQIPVVNELFDCETGYPFEAPKPPREVVKEPPPPPPPPDPCEVPPVLQEEPPPVPLSEIPPSLRES